jgi:hypothetical protein
VAYPELLSSTPKNNQDLPPSPSPSSAYLSSSEEEEDAYFSRPPKSDSSASSLASTDSSPKSLVLKQLPEPSEHDNSNSLAPVQDGESLTNSTYKLPFFSFTRTPEGTSLTTDVDILTALFPPSEREMVMGSGELDRADGRLNAPLSSLDVDDDDASDEDGARSTLKCLQVDLRKYGLGENIIFSARLIPAY